MRAGNNEMDERRVEGGDHHTGAEGGTASIASGATTPDVESTTVGSPPGRALSAAYAASFATVSALVCGCAGGHMIDLAGCCSGVSGPAGVQGETGVLIPCPPWLSAGEVAYDEQTVEGAREDERE